MIVDTWFTSLAGVTPQAALALRVVLPDRRSFLEPPRLKISRDKKRKLLPYPEQALFAVRLRLPSILPASPSGPFMVELFAAAFCAVSESGRSRSLASPQRNSPRRRTLNEPDELSTRLAADVVAEDARHAALVRTPWGDLAVRMHDLTLFNHHGLGLQNITDRGSSLSPTFR